MPGGPDGTVPSQDGEGEAKRVNEADTDCGLANPCESPGPVPIVKLTAVNLLARKVARGLADAGLRTLGQSLCLLVLTAGFSEP